jgi:hypothetical protein
MHPGVRRVLVHGAFTAGALALVGVLFAELASIWAAGSAGRPGSADLNPPLDPSLRYRIPLTMAGAGFLFVAVCELAAWYVRGNKPPAKPTDPPPDDAEKLLNELLAQAEAKMAAESEAREQKTEGGERKPDAPQI